MAGTPGLWSGRAQGRGRAGPTCGLGTPGPPSPSTQPPHWREAREVGRRVTASALRRQEAAWMHLSAFGVSLEEAPLFKGLNIAPVKFVCATQKYLHKGAKSSGFPGGISGREPTCQCRRHKRLDFGPWVGNSPWRRAWQLTPLFDLDNHIHRGDWQAEVHRVAQS